MINNIVKKQSDLEYLPAGGFRMEYVSGIDGLSDWAMVAPTESATWVVCLHGYGSHGDQLFTRQDIRQAWLPAFVETGAGILCPNLRDNARMSPDAVSDLHDLISWLRDEYAARKFIFFSGSMGGTGNLIYATRHPEDVSACAALGATTDLSSFYDWCITQPDGSIPMQIGKSMEESYGCKPEDNPSLFDGHSALKNCDKLTMPVFFAHGAADKTIPVEQARQLAAKMQGKKNFEYHEIPNGNHDSPLFIAEAFEFLKKITGSLKLQSR